MARDGVVSASEILRKVAEEKERTPGDAIPLEDGNDRLLKPNEVAALFRVDPKTVTRWAISGKLKGVKTLGGHRRFRESVVRELLRKMDQQ